MAEVYSPVGGEVVAVNEALLDRPEQVNEDPYGEGWLVELRQGDDVAFAELMDAQRYKEFVEGGS